MRERQIPPPVTPIPGTTRYNRARHISTVTPARATLPVDNRAQAARRGVVEVSPIAFCLRNAAETGLR